MGTWDTWSEVKNMQYKKGVNKMGPWDAWIEVNRKREYDEKDIADVHRRLEHLNGLIQGLSNRIYDLTEKLEEERSCSCGCDCAEERPEPTPMAEEAYKDELRMKAEAIRRDEALRRDAELVRKYEMLRRDEKNYGSFPY